MNKFYENCILSSVFITDFGQLVIFYSIIIIQYNSRMNIVFNALRICCPWFFKSTDFSEYQKRLSETEHQQFMKETIQQNGNDRNQLTRNKKNLEKVQIQSRRSQEQDLNSSKLNQQSLLDGEQKSAGHILSGLTTSNYKQYRDCINSNHPYYNLLKSKLEILPTIFDIGAEPESKISQNEYNLKILNKQSQDDKTNIFVYSFVFPTTYEFYDEMQNNFELQKSFDSNIDVYECREKVDDSTKLIYLAYKRILIVSPRDFIYVRYCFKKFNEYWSIATSILNQEPIEGKTRGIIILTVTRAIEKDGKLQLTVYSHVDMKMHVKASAAKVRGITQIKKYLDKCYQHVLRQKNNSII